MTNEEAIDELKRIRHHGTERLIKALEIAISALESQRWIPVEERLPEDDETIIVYKPLAKGTTIEMQITQGWCLNPTIMSHWMPLPQPPKEES